MNKVMSYPIIKPTNVDWDTLGKILRLCQNEIYMAKNALAITAYNISMRDYLQDKDNCFSKEKRKERAKEISHAVYYMAKEYAPNTVTKNIAAMQQKELGAYTKSEFDLLIGKKSLRSFRSDQPIELSNQSIYLFKENDEYCLSLGLLSTEGKKSFGFKKNFLISVIICAKDKSQKVILDRCLSGEYKVSGSQIIRKKNKWIFNLCYGFEAHKSELDPENILGVDLGITAPVYMATNYDNYWRESIRDNSIINQKIRLAKKLSIAKSQRKCVGDGSCGHGHSARMKVYNKYASKAYNLQQTKNHIWSRFVVDQAIKKNCGTIQMENLSGFTESQESTYLKNWSYYDLQQKIKYKAEEKGISVVFIDPKQTSQRCSKCGCIHRENRPKKPNQSVFCCIECGYETNADFNAAKNIAIKNIDKIIADTVRQQKEKEKLKAE